MAIDVVVNVQHNGGFVPDIIIPMLLPLGNPIECHEEVLSLQPTIPPKLVDIPPNALAGGCSEKV